MVDNDVQLIRSILSGNDEAFSTLVQKYQKSVHALAWRKTGDFHYAEEITQDTFLRAYQKLSTLKNPKQFSGWLYVIANRLCINWFKRHKPAMQSLEDTPVEEVEASSYASYVSEQSEAEGTSYNKEIAERLLAKLPESERTVMTLNYLGEMNAKEISKFLGVSVNTITSRLNRARKRLREDQELLVQEALGGIQLPASLTKNIMRKVADMKPTPSPVGKPLLPWTALGTATLLIALLLGASNQLLVHFQRPYSFEAESEPTIEIVDSFIVLDIDSKSDVRNQIGRADSTDKNSNADVQAADGSLVSDTQGNALGPTTLLLTPKADMPTARYYFSTCVVDGKIFVIGGELRLEMDEYGDLATTMVEVYDPETDTWERKADMPTARSSAAVSVVDGKIYAVGGSELKKVKMPRGYTYKSKELPTVEMYDPITDTWTQKADMPTPKKTMSCVLDGKIYAIGGWLTTHERLRLKTVDVYDPATNRWAKAQSMNRERCSAALSVVNGEIYAIGGMSWPGMGVETDLYLSSIEVFNPKTNQWRARTGMSGPKAYHTASVIDEKIYVVGGYLREGEESKTLSTVEIYNPTTDRWTQEPDMPISKWGHATEVVDGQIYIFGGGPITSVQVYDPSAVAQRGNP